MFFKHHPKFYFIVKFCHIPYLYISVTPWLLLTRTQNLDLTLYVELTYAPESFPQIEKTRGRKEKMLCHLYCRLKKCPSSVTSTSSLPSEKPTGPIILSNVSSVPFYYFINTKRNNEGRRDDIDPKEVQSEQRNEVGHDEPLMSKCSSKHYLFRV